MKHILFLLSGIALMLVNFYSHTVEVAATIWVHHQVIAGTAEAPVRYRALSFWVTEALARLLPIPHDAAVVFIEYHLIGGAALALFVIGVYVFLRRLYSADTALIGGLFACLTGNVVHLFPSLAAYTWIEAACVVWSLVWLHRIYCSHSLSRSQPSTGKRPDYS